MYTLSTDDRMRTHTIFRCYGLSKASQHQLVHCMPPHQVAPRLLTHSLCGYPWKRESAPIKQAGLVLVSRDTRFVPLWQRRFPVSEMLTQGLFLALVGGTQS